MNDKVKEIMDKEKCCERTAYRRIVNVGGKKSERERGKRYRATEKGRLNSLKKSRAYFERHKDDPAWREHRRQVQKAWKRRKREEKEKQ